ncbi:MAG: hypothetical protein PHC89_01455 [Candidatus Pacebacteria bacterium]|nr:hypothetical protein [Candidatus Paceibacterota bacterium]
MDIKKVKEFLKQRIPLDEEKVIIFEILKNYYPELDYFDFKYSKGTLYLSKIPPLYRTHIKLNKMTIKKLAKEKGLGIYDII